MIQQYYSIRIELNKVLQTDKYKQLVFENLKRCKRTIGVRFRVIFWHHDLDKKILKEFTENNEDVLFKLGVQITKKKGSCWFLIKSSEEETSSSRYRYEGDILEGIVEYLAIINHIQRRDKE